MDPNIFNTIIVFPILNLLVAFYKLFESLKIPGEFGFSIIALTVLVRIILHPLFKQQIDAGKKMQDIQPALNALSKKYKNDKTRLQKEQMKLYQEAGINPTLGCLLPLLQLPVFFGLYQTLSVFISSSGSQKVIDSINKALYFPALKIGSIDPWFFGINLTLTPAKAGPIFLIVPIVTGLLQFVQAQVSMPAKKEEVKKEGELKKKDEKSTGGDFQQALNMQMKYFFPVMIGWFSYNFPIGLALYWNIFSLFSILQYYQLRNSKKQNGHDKGHTGRS